MNNIIEKKVLENVPGLQQGQTVTLLKMSYGIQSDYQNDCVEVYVDDLGRNKTKFNPGLSRIFSLVHGIYESESLQIKPYADVEMGLSDSEKESRKRIVRNNIPRETAEYLLERFNEFNTGSKKTEQELQHDERKVEETIKKP